jgi:hypothetical protein
MMAEKNNIYDYIVYGATIPGIVYAMSKARQNKSVLLVNHYGFPGGSITESLSCRQYIHVNSLTPIVRQIFSALLEERSAVTALEDNGYCFDPEAVKKVLQELLEASTVHLLYHVIPTQVIASQQGGIQITLSAKEGMLDIKGKVVFDASDEQFLSLLSSEPKLIQQRILNVIVHSKNVLSTDSLNCKRLVKISEDRYWVSFDLFGNGRLEEDVMQEKINKISEKLSQHNARIQLLPIRLGYGSYPDFENNRSVEGIVRLTEIVQKTNPQYFAFLNAATLESLIASNA